MRSTPSSRAGTASPSPVARTRASTRPGRSRASTVEGGPPLARAAEALNAALPDDVAVLEAEEAPEGFHARFSARSRSYRYRVRAGADSLGARRAAGALVAAPVDVSGAPGGGRASRRRARLPRLHARPRRGTRYSDATCSAAAWAATATGSTSRSRPTASSATWCGRSSGRCSRRAGRAGPDREPARRRGRAPRRASPRHRGASISSGCRVLSLATIAACASASSSSTSTAR